MSGRKLRLALFDLDHTLIDGDSDYLWSKFLIDVGALDRHAHEEANRRFLEDYRAGRLDIDAFLRFQLAPLSRHPRATLDAWHERFLAERIAPIVKPKTPELLARHAAEADLSVIVTATNRFITAPIARLLGVPHLVATELEEKDGAYTGAPLGEPCFREGKLGNLDRFLASRGASWADVGESCFYSDSHNDLPLLSRVSRPVAVDPDAKLRAHAEAAGWAVISLK